MWMTPHCQGMGAKEEGMEEEVMEVGTVAVV